MKKSMKRVEIHVPPWHRLAYLHAKWFGSYKRTINEIPVRDGSNSSEDLTEELRESRDLSHEGGGELTREGGEQKLTTKPPSSDAATHKAISGMGKKGGRQPIEQGSLNDIDDESTNRQTASIYRCFHYGSVDLSRFITYTQLG
ncbi:Uncharacterized protein Fot_24037 [Forsythia ovata]|uniref:Uncharacterized protein n=1 Tax=Forsythia ovata TaxID=205694 RepID=A0ABD1U537_9LAMI